MILPWGSCWALWLRPLPRTSGGTKKTGLFLAEEFWKTHPHHSDSSPSVRQTRFLGNPDTALVAMRYLATSGGNPQRSHIFERSGSSIRLSTQFSSKSSHPMVNTPWIQESPNRPIVDIFSKLVISHCHFTLPQGTAPFMSTQLQNSQETLQPGWVPYIYHGEFACQVMETPEFFAQQSEARSNNFLFGVSSWHYMLLHQINHCETINELLSLSQCNSFFLSSVLASPNLIIVPDTHPKIWQSSTG